ncbi:pentatricopeptide repeat-containing protein At2g17140 [Eucalyptus grandis]|uniref:pentatricopeptide repeat-containing protein At2g17140 n=1 Tax=Eucalyptus grandis TaxID=71139 RepID=UPI00192F0C73|nr:pentatricopeptide repeat-containing protein At2g17140 [Eucalyptus grandis]XP_039158601.1 pentatricopeptide repeat-containing protein At2g17140 [Eucalyptus grandis]
MDPTAKLAKALFKNSGNPKLAWQLFKRILSSPPSPAHAPCIARSLPIVSRILVRARMLPEIDHLRALILSSCPAESRPSSLVSLVKLLARSGLPAAAVSHFKSLRSRFPDDPPPGLVYNLLIRACLRENRVDDVLWLYRDMVVAGLSPETYTFNLLIDVLCEAGRLSDARNLFEKMPKRGCMPNEYSFGILVRGYCRARLTGQGLELLNEMKSSGIAPNNVVYNTLISSLCREGMTDEAEKLVERMRGDGLSPDIVTFNSRISALCAAGKVLEASRIFRDMLTDQELGLPEPNTVTYNLMLQGFCKEGMWEEAKTLGDTMKRKGELMKLESYNIQLLGLIRKGNLLEAQSIINEMIESGVEPSIYTYNIVIDGLCKNGMLSDARTVMHSMQSSSVSPDTISYSTLAQGYCSKGKMREARNILQEMMKSGCFPNNYTSNFLLHSLWKEGKTSEAEKLLQKMNERGYGLDTVTCNIVIHGLCLRGELDKAMEIVSGMWSHGSAALGNLGNSFIGLVDNANDCNKCSPDLISYSTVISGLCKAGRVEEAKKMFAEMMSRKIRPDSVIYDSFVYALCKEGKLSSAFRVLKDMEKKGCSRRLQTYNSLILGLGRKNQIFEIYGLLDEMKERGIPPNVCTFNNFIRCLCEGGRINDAPSILDEMIEKGVFPNITTFKILIRAFCKAGDFGLAQEMFEIALNICGHKEPLYSLLFNELLAGKEIEAAEELFKAAINRHFDLEDFLSNHLINILCNEGKIDDASGILNRMIDSGYGIDPASFMPVIDGLRHKGNKKEADQLAERMMDIVSNEKVAASKERTIHRRPDIHNEYNWQSIVQRDDGSRTVSRTLKDIQKGWGQGSIPSLQQKKMITWIFEMIRNLFYCSSAPYRILKREETMIVEMLGSAVAHSLMNILRQLSEFSSLSF